MTAGPIAIDFEAADRQTADLSLPVGARAPAFAGLLGADGRRYGLADFAGKSCLVLIFSSNRCPTAKGHADRLNRLQRQYGPRGVQVVAINSNDPHLYPEESYSRMVSLARESGFEFPYLFDEGQHVARAYGPTHTFHAYVFDSTRRLRYRGRFDDARVAANVTKTDVADALDDLLANRPLRVTETEPFGCSLDILDGSRRGDAPVRRIALSLWAAIAAAWLVTLVAMLSGHAATLHHGSLIERGPPLPLAALLATGAWLVMAVAMMLPGSVRTVVWYAQSSRTVRRSGRLGAFLGGYLGTWAAFGLACFLGDAVLHRVVDAIPWLAAHSFVVQAGVVGLAGAYQLLPFTQRCLSSCRNPLVTAHSERRAVVAGVTHAVDCLRSCWPLMLLMFAAGVANIFWMVGLTGLIAYQSIGRHGLRAARGSGLVLIWLALFALTNQGLPAWLGD